MTTHIQTLKLASLSPNFRRSFMLPYVSDTWRAETKGYA